MKKESISIPSGHGDIDCPHCGGALDDEVTIDYNPKVTIAYSTEMECIYCEKMFTIDWKVVSNPIRLRGAAE
jgi:uncharacterized Zn-finger protein